MRTARSGTLRDEIDAAIDQAEAIQPVPLPTGVPYDINQAAMRFPDFTEGDADSWFEMIEAFFVHAKVRDSKAKFYQVLARLPQYILKLMKVNTMQMAAGQEYQTIKNELLAIYGASNETRIQSIINLRQLGSTHPLQLLAELMGAIPAQHESCMGCSLPQPPCPVAYGIFRLRLPEKVRTELPTEPNTWSEVRVAVRTAWDKHFGLAKPNQVSAAAANFSGDNDHPASSQLSSEECSAAFRQKQRPQAQARPRTEAQARPDVCYHHYTFGEDARRCHSSCKFNQDFKAKRGSSRGFGNGNSGNASAGRR